ncbi:MAG: alginate export family protein [Bacteroidales bacterium]|nr:alginate export family protein [Bacteroidales bacterium]
MKKFTSLKKILVITFLVGLLGDYAYGQFSLSGEIRPRMEYLHGYSTLTDKDSDPAGFASQRTRINFNYSNERVKMGVSVQDVFLWGSQPQLFSTSNTLSLHQAWAQYFIAPSLSLKLGRQELVYDDERIFGNSNWDQQGRSHDVALLRYDGMLRIDIGAAFNQDEKHLNGSYYKLHNYKMMQFVWLNTDIVDNLNLSLLFLNNGYQHDYKVLEEGIHHDKTKNVFNQTLGGRLLLTPGDFNMHASAYYTMGKDTEDRDLSAYYVGLGVDYNMSDDWNLGIGWEHLSGTDQKDMIENPNGYKNKSFNPFYGTSHKFNGFMDYFNVNSNWSNSVGLNDLFASVQFSRRNFEINLTGHAFLTAASVIKDGNVNETMEPYLGTEIDLTMSYRLSRTSNVVLGYSQMIGSETLQAMKGGDRNACNNWAYLMFTFKPVFLK